MKKYPIVFAPAIAGIEKEHINAAKEYVKGGGVLCFSGVESPELLKEFFGGELIGFTDVKNVYSAPTEQGKVLFAPFSEKYPLSLSDKHPLVKMNNPDVSVLATLTLPYSHPTDKTKFASIHSNPPGIETDIPMIVVKNRGKGRVIWSAATIEGMEMDEYQHVVQKLLLTKDNLMQLHLAGEKPRNVEITLFSDESGMCINAVNLTDDSVSAAVPGFNIHVRTEKAPKKVALLPEETEIPFEYADGYVMFNTLTLNIFDMYRIYFE